MPFYPIVVVEWSDAYGDGQEQWFEGSEVTHDPLVVKTIGYMMKNDDIGVTLWQDMCKEDGSSYRGKTVIPKGMIRSVTELQPKRKRKAPTA